VIKRWDLEPDWKYSVDRVTDGVDRIVELDREVRKELMKYSSKELIKKPLSRGLLPEALRRLVGRPVIVRSYTLKEALSEKLWYVRRSILKVEVNDKEDKEDKEVLVPNSLFRMSETLGRMPVEKMFEQEVLTKEALAALISRKASRRANSRFELAKALRYDFW
jgi:hypothetical protein